MRLNTVIVWNIKATIELLVIITSVLFDQTYSEVEAKARRVSVSHFVITTDVAERVIGGPSS